MKRTAAFFVPASLAVAALILALLLGPGSCSNGQQKNVILVVIDTLRADRLGCLGNDAGMTPNIDSLASEGVLFENAFSHAPWTLPSFASLFSSTYPRQHGAGAFLRLGSYTTAHDGFRTMGHCFQEAKYRTAAIVNVLFASQHFRMDRGFDKMDYVANEGNHLVRTADKTTDAALEWLEKNGDEPFFLMVHYFDPHLLYEAPAAFRSTFAMEEDKQSDDPLFGQPQEVASFRQGTLSLDEALVSRLEALYNAEVAFTDRELGRLMRRIGEMGLDDSTIVVLTADHGEEFFDHGGFEHGHSLYDELIHVPLVIRDPGVIPVGKRVESVVRHVDVAPTICRLAGIAADPAFVGDDLSPYWQGGATKRNRPVLAEGNFWGPNRLCLRDDGLKTIVHLNNQGKVGKVELYDLDSDPAEQHDLSGESVEKTSRLVKELNIIYRSLVPGEAREAELTEEMRRTLKELGY